MAFLPLLGYEKSQFTIIAHYCPEYMKFAGPARHVQRILKMSGEGV